MSWERANGDFLEADVIEWQEAVWPPTRRRRKKQRPSGRQSVIGQITEIDGDFVMLTILKAAITENRIASELRPYKVGSTITKKRQTLLKGDPKRLHWSEEDVRAALLAEQHHFESSPT